MIVLATDMDRTLLPNGKQPYDDSIPLFNKIIEKNEIPLIYVTGRDISLIKGGIVEYGVPYPKFAIADVGTKIYAYDGMQFNEDSGWPERIEQVTQNWNKVAFKEILSAFSGVRLQEEEKQNSFKLSYYVEDIVKAKDIVETVTPLILAISSDVSIVYSVDEINQVGLLDVLPKCANKVGALEYLRKKNGISKDELVYAGDSGNDILPLTFGYRSIVVRNAIEEVKIDIEKIIKEKKIEDTVYFARGNDALNGYYVSGILEGMLHFGLITPECIQ